MSWTDERVERLKALWAEGLSASQIAADLGGVTRNAVIGKVHRLGLSGRAKPQVQAARPSAPPLRQKSTASPAGAVAASSAPVDAVSRSSMSSGTTRPSRPITIGNTAIKAEIFEDVQANAAPLPVPARVVEVEPVVFEKMSILNLTEQTCKWPIGDPGRPDFFFCGRKSETGVPYCIYHSRIAYQPSNERRQRDRRAAAG